MKVAFILPSLASVGPIIATFNLVEQLVKQNIYVEVFYFDDVIGIEFPSKVTKISFKSIITFNNFDFIHTVGFRPDLYIFLYKSFIKPICISNIHNYIFEDFIFTYGLIKGLFYSIISIFSLLRHNLLIVSTNNMYLYYKKIFIHKNIKTIMYGIPNHHLVEICDDHINLFAKIRPYYKIIGSIGLLITRKGYSQLIDLLCLNKDYIVVIIGDGPDKHNLIKYAQDLGVSERFFILGFQPNSYNYIPNFDLYIVTSYSEGFSLAMADAFSIGIPVVLSYIPTHFNTIPDDVVNFFKLQDVYSLDKAITNSLNRKNYFSKKSKKFYYDFLDEQKVGCAYKFLYLDWLQK